jgi:CheY-like chemotaxis protein
VREGLRGLLESRPDLEVAAVCGDLDSLLAAVEAEEPDVVLTDIRMPPGNADEGIQAAGRLRETHPGVGVVVLSQYADPSFALALLESGSEGRSYLLKERIQDLDGLVSAIEAVAEALNLARAAGVDPGKVREALLGGFAASKVLEVHGQRMLDGAFEPGFRSRMHRKDARIVNDTAQPSPGALETSHLPPARRIRSVIASNPMCRRRWGLPSVVGSKAATTAGSRRTNVPALKRATAPESSSCRLSRVS